MYVINEKINNINNTITPVANKQNREIGINATIFKYIILHATLYMGTSLQLK